MKVLYLRTDFWFGLQAGGSVAHTAGVISALRRHHDVTVVTTDVLPGMGPATVIPPWWPLRQPGLRALGPLVYPLQLRGLSDSAVDIDFVYHRHAPLSAAGAVLARRLGCPLVLEVNGLMLRWAREQGDRTSQRIGPLLGGVERWVFRHTRLFAAISTVVRDQLIEEGIPPERIVVSPNGVDPAVFHPDVSRALRAELGLQGTVVGFIGTFGAWHGLPELTAAILAVASEKPDIHFLLVGDGPGRAAMEEALAPVRASVTFTGLVPQADAPRYLAACDIFVCPHGRPQTGRFIGSPTKLFEYMAMGRGIVASNLDQIGEILGENALLVPPGDAAALAAGIRHLAADQALAAELGRAARAEVLARWTWDHTVARVTDALPRA